MIPRTRLSLALPTKTAALLRQLAKKRRTTMTHVICEAIEEQSRRLASHERFFRERKLDIEFARMMEPLKSIARSALARKSRA